MLVGSRRSPERFGARTHLARYYQLAFGTLAAALQRA